MPNSERHPLAPFLPCGARLLMLGSFPPPRKRWSMEFFYPNLQNDMWRIIGHLATGDKLYFLNPEGRFDRERIVEFCTEQGIALYDAAEEVIRLKDNASDEFLEVIREVDLTALLAHIPACCDLVTTGAENPPRSSARSSAAKPPKWASASPIRSLSASCASGVCPPLRVPFRGRWSGRPNFTEKYFHLAELFLEKSYLCKNRNRKRVVPK